MRWRFVNIRLSYVFLRTSCSIRRVEQTDCQAIDCLLSCAALGLTNKESCAQPALDSRRVWRMDFRSGVGPSNITAFDTAKTTGNAVSHRRPRQQWADAASRCLRSGSRRWTDEDRNVHRG